jgi:hypothetical protein
MDGLSTLASSIGSFGGPATLGLVASLGAAAYKG